MLPSRFTYPSPGFSHYWNEGFGSTMLQKLSKIPDKKAIEEQATLLQEYDQAADAVIHELYEKKGFRKSGILVEQALEEGILSLPTGETSDSLHALFKEAEAIPDWLNWDELENGAAFCRRSGAFALVVLRNYCLMGGYESASINKPLIFTEALKKGAAKRMAETIEFWVDVTGESALKRFAPGFKSCIKVRLMHAYARVAIQKTAEWKNEQWGVPLNQWDMLATNLGFSLVFMDGLKRLGFKPTEKEMTGLLHFWKYIGYLLGIKPSYLPDTETQAIEALYKWTICQPAADDDTRALAHALMNEPMLASFPVYYWQKRLMIKLHLGYHYFFLGDRACRTMALPKTIFRYLPYLARFLNKLQENKIISQQAAYQKAVESGRSEQVRIKKLFLMGHASNLPAHSL